MRMQFRAFFVVFLSCLLGLSGTGSGSFSFADTLGDKQDTLDALQEKQASYQKIINIKKNQEALLSSQITTLSAQTDQLAGTIEENTTKLQETNQKISALVLQIAEKESVLSEQKKLLADFVRSYADGGLGEAQSVVLGDTPSSDVFALQDQLLQFQDKVSETVERIESVRKALDRDREALQRDKTETETLNEKLAQQTAYLESAKQQKQTLVMQTVAEKDQYQKKLSKVEEEIKEIEQEIESMESEKSNNLDFSKLPSRANAAMGYPLEKGKITQGYGKTTFTRWYSFHNGVDFGVPSGTEVLAAASGQVIATGDSGRYAYGKWVAVDHGNGLVTLYGHFSKQKVSRGDSVNRGDIIGLSGNTGYSTGPHLHFSVFSADSFEVVSSTKVSGVKIPTGAHMNPMRYL